MAHLIKPLNKLNKKAIAFATIVTAIIAVTVLVMVVLYSTGSLSRLFGASTTIEAGATSQAETTANINKCQQYCLQAQAQSPADLEAWQASDFCKNYDVDNPETKICSAVGATCTVTLADTTPVTQAACTPETTEE